MSDVGGVQSVGARLVLLDSAAFKAKLQQATDAVAEFNDAQKKAAETAKGTSKVVTDSATTQAGAVSDSADKQVEANAKIATSQDAVATSSAAARATVVGSMVATTKAHAKATKALSEFSSKILLYGGAVGAFAGYEGVKKYLAFNQQITQLGINAGVAKSQLGAFSAAALKVSDSTGLAATSIGDIFYRIASANPKIKATTASLVAMGQQAANLTVMEGAGGNADTTARLYGAIVSNQLSIAGGRSLGYSTASGAAINAWANAVTGKGDVKMGDLVAAMGTGILPVAKTFGLNLNQVGGMLDVLFPAMNASSASTRLKTAISMLGAPSPTATQAYELFGANATTPGGLLRSKGPVAMLNYLHGMLTGRVTGANFANAFYGSGLGSITGGTKGVGTGAGEYLRVAGFTPGQISVMEGAGGIAAFAKMSPAQLAAVGFGRGTTGAIAEQTIQASLLSKMFGGGHTGAAVMQLMNQRGVLAGKIGSLGAAETPAAYNAALNLAFKEPKVQLAMFGQAISNLTIEIGQGLTPVVTSFAHDLLGVGQWFGKNKWAVEAVLGGAGLVYAGAGVVKTVEVTSKILGGIKSIASLGGSAPLTANLALNTAAVNANTVALGGKLPKGLPGDVVPGGSGVVPFLKGAVTKTAVGALALYGYNAWAEPYLRKHLTSQEDRTANDVAHGAIIGATIASIVPGVGTLFGGGVGGALGLMGSFTERQTLTNPVTLLALRQQVRAAQTSAQNAELSVSIYGRRHGHGGMYGTLAQAAKAARLQQQNAQGSLVAYQHEFAAPMSPAARIASVMGVGLGPAGTFMSSITAASHLKGTAAQGTAAFNAGAQLVAAAVQTKDAATHYHESAAQITASAKEYSATLVKLITSAGDQTTAATQTESAANNLATVTKELASAAVNLNAAAANSALSHQPGAIHAAATAGLKNAVARK